MCFLRGFVVGICLVFGGCGLLASEGEGCCEVKSLNDEEGEKYDKMYRDNDKVLVNFSGEYLETSWKYLCPKGYDGPFETCRLKKVEKGKEKEKNLIPSLLESGVTTYSLTGEEIPYVIVSYRFKHFEDIWNSLRHDMPYEVKSGSIAFKMAAFLGYDIYFRKKVKTTFEINGVKFEFVKIKGGTYTMGSPDDEKGRYNDEVRRDVKVESFLMGKYPVTQAQYKVVMGKNPSKFKGDDYPVTDVSYNDANAFIEKLNNLTEGKLVGRLCLPSEEYWEYAARGGETTAYWWGDDEALASQHCWWNGNSGGMIHLVGAEGHENPYGISDMLGNVFEMTSSHPNEMHKKVARGGSYLNGIKCVRSAYRHYIGCDQRYLDAGFRLMTLLDY